MELTYLCISLLLILASYLFTSLFRRKFSNLPPTVFPTLPIIGHLYLLKAPLYRTLAKISAKYGPILLLNLGSRRLLLVSSPTASEECFTKNDLVFANRPRMIFGKIAGNNYTTLAWAPYNDNWRNLRRIASMKILSANCLNEFKDIRVDEVKLLVRQLYMSSSPVPLKSLINELNMNVMMRMISGKRYFGGDIPEVEEEGKVFKEIVEDLFKQAEASHAADFLPFMSWFGVSRFEKKLTALVARRDLFFDVLVKQLKNAKGVEGATNKKKNIIEVLLSLQESEPEYYTHEMIRSLVHVLVIGSTETTTNTMGWAWSLLLNNPQVIRKAQIEIDKHVGKDRFVDEPDMANLPYLRGIINEAMRLYPATPLLVPHESSAECVIGGYNIPRGTMLIVNQWAIHHDPKLWADPERFNPERFEGLEGSRDGFKLMAFGSGRRSCPGEGLAMRVIGLTMGMLIQCFEWERISEKMIDMTEVPGLSLAKAEPLVAKCKPRLHLQNLLSQL